MTKMQTMHKFNFTLLLLLLLTNLNFLAQKRMGFSPYFGIGFTLQKKVELIEGSVESLKKLEHFHIRYNYDSMVVCTFVNQEEYFNDLRSTYKEIKSEKLIREWKELPKKLLEPTFENNLNRRIRKMGMNVSNKETHDKQGTLIVTIIEEEPHQHNSREYPYLILRCTFFDKKNELIACFVLKAAGSSGFNITDRREGIYEIAGNMLGKEVYKRLKKMVN